MKRRYKPGSRPPMDRCGLTRKSRFPNRVKAIAALEERQREREEAHGSKRREVRAYRCWSCDGWHLTSQEKAS